MLNKITLKMQIKRENGWFLDYGKRKKKSRVKSLKDERERIYLQMMPRLGE